MKENRHMKEKNKYEIINKEHAVLRLIGIILSVFLIICIMVVILVNLFINYKLNKIQINPITTNREELGINEENTANTSEMSKFRNIALLGIDTHYDDYDTVNRTDCIIIASINQETNEVQLYSIYRDTYVQMELNGTTKMNKINQAYYNGVENTIKTINQNLDLNITEYVLVNFKTMIDLIDRIDGIYIDIDSEELKYINAHINDLNKTFNKNTEYITKTGNQKLNGVQAVAFCRIRYTSGKDYKRTERMREVLGKIIENIQTYDTFTILNLIDSTLPHLQTNITVDKIKAMIPQAFSFTFKQDFGWPYKTTGVWMRGDFFGPAATLETNVKKLHQEVYGQVDYEVPQYIKDISKEIENETGVHNQIK